MDMAVKIKKGKALSTLSLTPLIDVVFLLLIFFLVATRFAQEDRELDVMLPSASEAKPLTVQPKELFINVDHKGQYFVDGKIIGPDEVEQVLRRAAIDNPVSQSVIIRADKRVLLDAVVFVMNACNKVGILDYSLTTQGEGG
jgi:biopolymer transport protein ExbD